MTTNVSQAIREHHRELLEHLTRQVSAVVEDQAAADPQALVKFLKDDLVPHAVGEEQHMYPALDELVARYGKATATMSVDHEFIHNYIDAIAQVSQALETAKPQDRPALKKQLARLGLQLEALLRVHLEKEERVYLPLFEKYLTPEAQGKILDGMHEQYETPAAPVQSSLDVRTVPPFQRHVLIFQTFEALRPGQAFELVNDHDPKPLYYQFAAERSGEFTWEYQEQGPQVWRVRIGKATNGH